MSHLSKIFEEAPIRVQNRNGFDLSHTHAGTSKTGQLVPVLTKLLVPNSTISLGVNAEVNLPPLVAPFYGKVDFAIEGFIVPCSILYGGWKQFISNNEVTQFPASQSALTSDSGFTTTVNRLNVYTNTQSQWTEGFGREGYALPYVTVSDIATANGSLSSNFGTLSTSGNNIYDYMGYGFPAFFTSGSTDINISLLPALAYHKICDTFYRNTKLTRTWFAVNPDVVGMSQYAPVGSDLPSNYTGYGRNVSLIWHSFYTNSDVTVGTGRIVASSAHFNSPASITFPDGVSVFSTRQRTYMRDYFTSAVPSPQQGNASILQFSINTDDDGQFTINSLRMANALQKFLETNNLSGDYSEMIRNRWGVRPIDSDFDEPHYLGRVVVPVYSHTVYQNAATYDSTNGIITGGAGKNPYTSAGLIGAKSAVGESRAEGSICDNFNVTSWSYLMVLASLVPHANYNFGLNRELTMTSLGDFPAPELQGVGMEEIKRYELGSTSTGVTSIDYMNATFGYSQRYSRFKYMDDRVSGLLRPGKSLQYFQLQRSFASQPTLGTEFVTIPQNALDGVLNTTTSTSGLSCWWEIYFKLHVVMPLADYCVPTLGELQDTHTIKTTVGGSRL